LDKDVAAELGITAQEAARWRKRFLAVGMVGLEKDTRESRNRKPAAGEANMAPLTTNQ
jgi:hypothetical protein